MNYRELEIFVKKKMRMSHIYQPVVLISLLENHGRCSEREIAKALLSYDDSQIDYYIAITKNMVGKVLQTHGIIIREKETKEYVLNHFESISKSDREKIIKLCKERLEEFIAKRGKNIYTHRTKSVGYISGTIRYDVLKRAKFRCELCGVSAEEKALEVDHILPRNHGGTDELSNFQALCYSCNSMKRDRDDTDFREIRKSYVHRVEGCIFCDISKKQIVDENHLAFVIRDRFPVTELHSLIIPKRHTATYFDLGQAEINAINQLLAVQKLQIEKLDPTVDGFNIGINAGASAGQTIFHCHIHLIPRRDGDVKEPRGGIRNTIPGKGNY